MSIRAEIMDLPQEERLHYALDLLEQFTGDGDRGQIAWLRRHFGLSKAKARVLLALNAAYPRMMTHEGILQCLPRGAEDDYQSNNLASVYISHIRAALAKAGGPGVELIWGQGYRLTEKLDVGSIDYKGPFRRSCAWSEENDADLRRMAENGSDLAAMAYELERTERAVLERMRALGLGRGGVTDHRHYAPIIVRSAFPSDRERKFLASLIAAERKGRRLTERQAEWLSDIVRRFQAEVMRDGVQG